MQSIVDAPLKIRQEKKSRQLPAKINLKTADDICYEFPQIQAIVMNLLQGNSSPCPPLVINMETM